MEPKVSPTLKGQKRVEEDTEQPLMKISPRTGSASKVVSSKYEEGKFFPDSEVKASKSGRGVKLL